MTKQTVLYLALMSMLTAALICGSIPTVASESILIGDNCIYDAECGSVKHSYCNTTTTRASRCACKPPYRASPDRTSCKGSVPIGGQCQTPLDCVGSETGASTCNSGTCECTPLFVHDPVSTLCLIKATNVHKDKCSANIQCTAGTPGTLSYCTGVGLPFEGVCVCRVEAVDYLGKCYKESPQIGDPCEVAAQCTMANSRCLLGPTGWTCGCEPMGYTPAPDNRTCLAFKSLNEPCQISSQCSASNAECPASQTCSCRASYVQSTVQTNTCKPIIREINANCTEDIQCVAGLGESAHCLGGQVCQCKSNYGFFGGTCYIPAKLNDICFDVRQCYIGISNFTMCTESASDTGKRCRCLAGTTQFNGGCFMNKTIGVSCQSNEECTVSILGHSHCDPATRTCQCKAGNTPDMNNRACSGSEYVRYSITTTVTGLFLFLAITSQKLIFS